MHSMWNIMKIYTILCIERSMVKISARIYGCLAQYLYIQGVQFECKLEFKESKNFVNENCPNSESESIQIGFSNMRAQSWRERLHMPSIIPKQCIYSNNHLFLLSTYPHPHVNMNILKSKTPAQLNRCTDLLGVFITGRSSMRRNSLVFITYFGLLKKLTSHSARCHRRACV